MGISLTVDLYAVRTRLSDRLCMDAKEVDGSYVFGFVACSSAAKWAYDANTAQLTLLVCTYCATLRTI